MYKNVKKKIERGVAFPTCISVNNTVCHFSPLVSDETVMEAGDVLNMWAFLNFYFGILIFMDNLKVGFNWSESVLICMFWSGFSEPTQVSKFGYVLHVLYV